MNDSNSKSPTRKTNDIYGVLLPVKRHGQSGRSKAIYLKELTRYEVAAIGVITIQWAYLEHMLLLNTADLVAKGKIPMPHDATSLSFKRRLKAWSETIKAVIKDSWQRNYMLGLATKISNVQNDRHKITHGLWQWYPSKPIKLRSYSFRVPHEFSDNFDHKRLARLADRIGEINYELTYPPRKGLKKLKPDEISYSYMSREFLLRATGADMVALGVDLSPAAKFPPIQNIENNAKPKKN